MLGSDRLPTLPATRVVLREIAHGDAADYFAIFSDPQVVRFTNSEPLETLAQAHSRMAEIRARLDAGKVLEWGIARRADDRLIGSCKLFHLEPQHRRAEIGFALGRESWGRGYAREALATLIDYAFGELALHRLEADVDPRNVSSLRALEKLGFQPEGILRERYLINGEIQDTAFLGLLAREWPPAQPGAAAS